MSLNQKIRTLREQHLLSQEEMAEKMQMSLNGYAKIERGETKLRLDKLEKIAQIFSMACAGGVDFAVGAQQRLPCTFSTDKAGRHSLPRA